MAPHKPSRIGRKAACAESVYEMALQRCRDAYENHDKVVVSFSGGKDSTATLMCAVAVAEELGRLPVETFFYDEEAIPPETVEYMLRIAADPRVDLKWYCLPITCRNACSSDSPDWFPWAPEEQAIWTRELPPGAITEPPVGFARQTTEGMTPLLYPPSAGNVMVLMGIRAQESLTRHNAVCIRRGFDAYKTSYSGAANLTKGYPVYDWSLDDVWVAPNRLGWDYNRAYDLMEMVGLSRVNARCSPPYGEQPIRRLWSYKQCWPELWAKMTARVPGAATAARYANTDLYGINVASSESVPSFRDATMRRLQELPPGPRKECSAGIKIAIALHIQKVGTKVPVPDSDPHPISGVCWKQLYGIAQAGGDKLCRQSQRAKASAIREQRKQRAKDAKAAKTCDDSASEPN